LADVRMTFLGHLDELRTRLIRSLIAIGVAAGVACYFSPTIFHWLMQPVLMALPENARKLHPTSVMEKFTVYLKVGLYGGLFLASPALLFQVWRFVEPALHPRERRLAVPFILVGSLFFLGGAAFAYYVILPPALSYLVGLGGGDDSAWIEPLLSMDDQLSFVLALELAFGVIFEMPLILTGLAALGIVSARALAEKRRYAILINTILAAVITPTGDPLNLALMAVPMCVMYEVGIIGARIFGKVPEPLEGG
jgi:sec-independent protein translocase protein TatC